MKTVILTGASSGIGTEIAHLLIQDSQIEKLYLTGRSDSKLKNVVNQVSKNNSNIKIESITLDLSIPGASKNLYDKTGPCDVLINCAGKGDFGETLNISIESHSQTIQLNCVAVTELCCLYGKDMKSASEGIIINVGSIAGFQPIPYFNVYSASKSYLNSFSEALDNELKEYGVRVVCLCPGGVQTEFHKNSGMRDDIIEKWKNFIMSPKEIAQTTFNLIKKPKRMVIPGASNQFFYFAQKILPRNWLQKNAAKFYKEFL